MQQITVTTSCTNRVCFRGCCAAIGERVEKLLVNAQLNTSQWHQLLLCLTAPSALLLTEQGVRPLLRLYVID